MNRYEQSRAESASGLTLAIDYNRDRSLSGFAGQSSARLGVRSKHLKNRQNRGRGLAALVTQASEQAEMFLYVDTLQPFTG